MITELPLPMRPRVAKRCELLQRRGFQNSGRTWRRDDVVFRPDGLWLNFEGSWPDQADALEAHLGKSGLWKPVRAGQKTQLLFTVQQSLVAECEAAALLDDTQPSSFESVLDWALDTFRGSPANWASPDPALLDSYLPKGRLSIVLGNYTRQIELIRGPDRLALRVEILPTLVADLPAYRLHCLRGLLLEMQDRHHLVRLGFNREAGKCSLVAEIDLSGIPGQFLESMISTSVDALRWVASLLIEAADFISQAGLASRALEICAKFEPNP